jgi:hypothetical protein
MIFTDLSVGRMAFSFTKLATVLGRIALAREEALQAQPVWRIYAVYSGALSLRQYKSSRRHS